VENRSPDLFRGDDRDREDVVELVFRKALEDCDGGTCSIAPVLESCVRQVVDSLWDHTSLKTYVPLLAMRGVKECIANGTCEPRPGTA
jgi:hypothetical protein